MPTDDATRRWLTWWRKTGERELRCILMTAWDPVGSGDTPEAWDEYDSYALTIAHRARDGIDPETAAADIAAHLDRVEHDELGAAENARTRDHSSLAARIVAWHEWSYVHGGRPPHESVDDT